MSHDSWFLGTAGPWRGNSTTWYVLYTGKFGIFCQKRSCMSLFTDLCHLDRSIETGRLTSTNGGEGNLFEMEEKSRWTGWTHQSSLASQRFQGRTPRLLKRCVGFCRNFCLLEFHLVTNINGVEEKFS
jgi:hypothetical protein